MSTVAPSQSASRERPAAAAGRQAAEMHPRVQEALRPSVMRPRLEDAVGGHRPCHVLDAKYEPGLRATVLYAYGDLLVRGDVLVSGARPTGGRPVVPPGVELSVYPDDAELPSLAAVATGRALTPLLPEAGARHRGDQAPLAASVRLLRYRPGRRATLLVSVRGQRRSYVAKVYRDATKAAAVAGEAEALHDAARRCAVLRLAPPAGHAPALAAVLQHRVTGAPLHLLLGGRRPAAPAATEAVDRAALALAQLHGLPAVSGRVRSVDAELLRFAARGARIGSVDPPVGTELVRLAERLTMVGRALPRDPAALVHGDCKPSQFLIADGIAWLLDLDHCGVAEPATDVGTFLASLRQLAVRRRLAGVRQRIAEEPVALGERFLATYRAARGDGAPESRARWHEAVALERKALRAFARAPRSPLPRALVLEAHLCLDQLPAGRR
jgi:aminoglycoside phosphotransferase (APT) family kinase protein